MIGVVPPPNASALSAVAGASIAANNLLAALVQPRSFSSMKLLQKLRGCLLLGFVSASEPQQSAGKF